MTGGEYTKAELIALCNKAIHKQATVDKTIFDAYINRYLAAAVNYVNVAQYYLDIQAEGIRAFNGAFYAVYENVPVQWNDQRKKHYIDLPAKLLPLPLDRAIPYLGPMVEENNQFVLVSQNDVFHSGKYFEFTNDVFGVVEGMRVILHKIPSAVDKVLLKMVVSIDDIADDDYVGIPAGKEIEVINLVVQFFTGVRALPENKLNDNRDTDAKQ